MPTRLSQLDRELSLPEMLADPIVQAVMARDGVTREEVEGLIGAIRRKPARTEHHQNEPQRISRLGVLSMTEASVQKRSMVARMSSARLGPA